MENRFFITTPVGLEQLAWEELQLKWPILGLALPSDRKMTKGGFEIHATPQEIFLYSQWAKIPTRILWRLHQQKCRDLPKLFNIINRYTWKNVLTQMPSGIEVTCSKSRLIHSDRVKETVRDAIEKSLQGNPAKKKDQIFAKEFPLPKVYIRITNDILTVSLDLIGEGFIKPHSDKWTGKAPVRDQLASALAFILYNKIGKDGELSLFDPMAGSGTLIWQMANFFHPHLGATMPWQGLPFTRRLIAQKKKHYEWPIINGQYWAYDQDEKMTAALQHNRKLIFPEDEHQFHLGTKDFFTLKEFPKAKAIVCNPPYGIRINRVSSFYTHFFKQVEKSSCQYLGLIIPRDQKRPLPQFLKEVACYDTMSGGIPIYLWILKKN